MIADRLLLVHYLQKRLRERLDGKFADKWRNCKVLSNNKDLLAKHKPDAAVVGIPPHLHGESPARLPPQWWPVLYCECSGTGSPYLLAGRLHACVYTAASAHFGMLMHCTSCC